MKSMIISTVEKEREDSVKKIEFSVSMCVYKGDNSDHFDTAIESVVRQTILPSEIVLVVDGPVPDKTNKIIEKYKKNLTEVFFRVIRLKKNMGHGCARRVSFKNCSCDYIAIMDADDISKPDRFEKELNRFKKDNRLAIVGSHVEEFSDDISNILSYRMVKLFDKDIKRDMRKRCPMNQPTVMFRKKDVEEVGGYRDWYCNEDYYLWIRLAKAGKRFANIDESLVKMRIDSKTYERRGGKKYFCSEFKIQQVLLRDKMIGLPTFFCNVLKRLLVQIVLPDFARKYIFMWFARKK